MKFIIIGLGNFGIPLATQLTKMGNEVIAVDSNMEKVEAIKEKVTHSVCLDCTNQQAVSNLPLSSADAVMVCIGENEGANILATALMKQLKVKRLISRAVSPLHQTVLEAMQVDEIIHPEEETAGKWAKKLNTKGIIDYFEINDEFNIIEIKTPKSFTGKTLEELQINRKYNILVLTIINIANNKNISSINKKGIKVQEIASAKTMIKDEDILVLYGKMDNIEKLIKENH